MKLITNAEFVASRLEDYVARHSHVMGNCGTMRGIDMLAKLQELRRANVPDVEIQKAIMGHASELTCDACGAEPSAAVLFGDDPDDWESRALYLCGSCLMTAAGLIAIHDQGAKS